MNTIGVAFAYAVLALFAQNAIDVYKRQQPYTFFGITIQLSLYAMKTRSARG